MRQTTAAIMFSYFNFLTLLFPRNNRDTNTFRSEFWRNASVSNVYICIMEILFVLLCKRTKGGYEYWLDGRQL